MVRPFLENAMLTSKSPQGISYCLWCNRKSNNKHFPWRLFQLCCCASYLSAFWLTRSMLDLCMWVHADSRNHTFQCNPRQNHTIYSPCGNSIYRALTLSNIYKHWADATSFLSLTLSLAFSFPFLSFSFKLVDHMAGMLSDSQSETTSGKSSFCPFWKNIEKRRVQEADPGYKKEMLFRFSSSMQGPDSCADLQNIRWWGMHD